MSNFDVKIEKSCCCCGSSESDLRSMTQPHDYNGKQEIYINMIVDCFRLQILNKNEDLYKNLLVICGICVSRLRDASQFRDQVETAYNRIQDLINEKVSTIDKSFIEIEIPNVIVKYEQDSENEDDNHDSLTFNIKKESGNFNENNPNFSTSSNLESSNTNDAITKDCIEPFSRVDHKVSPKKSKKNIKNSNVIRKKKTITEEILPFDLDANDLTCKVCSQTFEVHEDLKSHVSMHLPNYVCHICSKTFTVHRYLTNHVRRHELSKTLHTCDVCQKTFNGKYSLHDHMKTHRRDYVRFKCPHCNEKFTNYYKRKFHLINVHNEVFPEKNKTSVDNPNTIKEKKKRRVEALPFELDENDLTCKICNQSFAWHRNLKLHMAVHFPNYVCHICSKTFTIQRNLYNHVRRHEQNKTLHTCQICNKSVEGRDNLAKHIKMHSDHTQTYKCPHCPETFRHFQNRTKHLIDVHKDDTKKYRCEYCSKYFITSGRLFKHVKTLHLKEKRYPCGICDMSFYAKHDLTRHMLVHTGEKNFQCEVCNKLFSRNSNLKVHMKIHDNIKDFVCSVCNKAFTQNCTLKEHMKLHENLDEQSKTI